MENSNKSMIELSNNRCESEWFSENAFEFETNSEGDLFVLTSDNNSEVEMVKEKLPDNSATKFLLKRLKKEGVI